MILVINTSQKQASDLADMFRYMGILSIGLTPSKALSKASFLYRAIIVMHPSELADYIDYVKRLQAYAPTSPIFAMCPKDEEIDTSMFEGRFSSSAYAANILKKIYDFASNHKITPPGNYRRMLVDVDARHTTPTINSQALNLTKTECMVLRYLIKVYPNTATPEEIISHIYSPSNAPNPSNIRTYVSIINKKSRRIFNNTNIVFSVKGKGYYFDETTQFSQKSQTP